MTERMSGRLHYFLIKDVTQPIQMCVLETKLIPVLNPFNGALRSPSPRTRKSMQSNNCNVGLQV